MSTDIHPQYLHSLDCESLSCCQEVYCLCDVCRAVREQECGDVGDGGVDEADERRGVGRPPLHTAQLRHKLAQGNTTPLIGRPGEKNSNSVLTEGNNEVLCGRTGPFLVVYKQTNKRTNK